MKVVIVNEGLAYPPKGGNWLRTLNLMLPLSRRHEITYVCRGSKDQEAVSRAIAFYKEHGIRAIVSPDHPTENRGAAFYGRLAGNLFSPLPYSISSHRSPHVRAAIRNLARTEHIDVFQFESLSYADTLRGTAARTLVVAHNVESQIWQRLFETEKDKLKRLYIGQQFRKYRKFEKRVLREATRVVTVSREDSELLRADFGVEHTTVVDNGVDVAYFADAAKARNPDPFQILFLGSLDWRPNLDSVEVLLDRIMPMVLAQEPQAKLAIVGRNPPAGLVKRVRGNPSIELHADVADVRPYLSRSAVMTVPLRIGGGSRLKILESVASGLPVVSSRIGCEGLIFRPDRDLVVVDGEREMADALVAALRDPARMEGLARSGRAVVDAHYDWSRLADLLEKVWEDVRGDAPTQAGDAAPNGLRRSASS